MNCFSLTSQWPAFIVARGVRSSTGGMNRSVNVAKLFRKLPLSLMNAMI